MIHEGSYIIRCISILSPTWLAFPDLITNKSLKMKSIFVHFIFVQGDDDQALVKELADKHDIVAINLVVK